eukprot:1139345-Pelagomonas_calceolata.AAC.6
MPACSTLFDRESGCPSGVQQFCHSGARIQPPAQRHPYCAAALPLLFVVLLFVFGGVIVCVHWSRCANPLAPVDSFTLSIYTQPSTPYIFTEAIEVSDSMGRADAWRLVAFVSTFPLVLFQSPSEQPARQPSTQTSSLIFSSWTEIMKNNKRYVTHSP